jgi:hypothetical protein
MQIFECQFCDKKFLEQKSYESHSCKQKERHEIVKTKRGARAFSYYKYWLNQMGRHASSEETYRTSKFFNSFLAFCEFEKTMMLPQPKKYIDYMIQNNVMPILWNNLKYYQLYMVNYDDLICPILQVQDSIRYISSLSESIGCKEQDLLSYIYVDDIYKLVQSKRLSPWFLLNSQRFLKYMQTSMNKNEKLVISNLVSVQHWQEKFKKHSDKIKQIKNMISECGY